MLQRTCVIRHREEDEGNVNQYGDPEILESETETQCEIQQVDRDEPEGAGELAVTEWVVFLPEDTPIDTTDQVILDDEIYEVTGQPERSVSLNNRWGFIEATVVKSGKVPSS